MQTKEDRIFAHYKSMKNSQHYRDYGAGQMWLHLARTWQMPIRELKPLIKSMKEARNADL